MRSADGSHSIRFRAVLQLDGRFFGDDTERPATDTFLVRRARPYIEGTLARIVEYRIMPDFGGGSTTLEDAYLVLFAVARRNQRQGIGSAVLHWLESAARVAGATSASGTAPSASTESGSSSAPRTPATAVRSAWRCPTIPTTCAAT